MDDNFIGNKARAKECCAALAEWRGHYTTSFDFITEASLNLADDPDADAADEGRRLHLGLSGHRDPR